MVLGDFQLKKGRLALPLHSHRRLAEINRILHDILPLDNPLSKYRNEIGKAGRATVQAVSRKFS